MRAGVFLAAGFAALVAVEALLLVLAAVLRFAAGFLAAGLRFGAGRFGLAAADRVAEPELEPELRSSIGHFPLITFCAASVTASAISEPSLVALAITLFAAFSVESAASIPASLIALRAFGLALIAAAAAASPAASISLLIAALAIFSVVDFDELDDFEELVRLLDFAIACLLFFVAV